MIRNGKLIQIVSMRSNDVWLGLPLDITQFSIWHQLAAAYLGVEMGTYIHNANSLHLYERDVEKARDFASERNVVGGIELPIIEDADAMRHAIERDVLGWTKSLSSSTKSELITNLVMGQIGSLRPYVELLAGEYTDPVWHRLKEQSYGRGW
jgi:hypothetical protein